MLERLRGLPRLDSLKKYLERLFEEEADRIVSIVLFGSMAKGTCTTHSDYDLLIIVSREDLSLKDRLYKYSRYSDGWVEPFTYTIEEVEEMFEDRNPLILDALKDGIILYDRGFWKNLRERFEKLLESGAVAPKKDGWIIREDRGRLG